MSDFIKEFPGKRGNLKIGDCTGNTNSPSVITAPLANGVMRTVWVWVCKYLVQREKKKPAKKFILIKMHELITT